MARKGAAFMSSKNDQTYSNKEDKYQKVLCCSSGRWQTHAAPNYKKSHPLVITLLLSLHPDRTLGERIKEH